MCGIAGVLSVDAPPVSRETLVAMAGALRHRGPDEHGLYRDARCGLAHARLSIIDLASGQQPMTDAAGDLVISYNGEVFDYVELRDELRARGAVFRTNSDTEVVLEAYRAWGLGALERLNGQFAFAIWDRRSRELVIARDRLGVRPIFLCAHGGRVWFASEVKAIFAGDRSIPRAIDPIGLGETFTFWTPIAPQTVFRGVEELRPGHARVYRADGTFTETEWWRPRYDETFRGSIDDATDALGAALDKATKLRMLRADVTVGSYLSGGLDSSVVAALAKRAIGEQLRTFSLRFTDAEYDETPFQREMVARLGSDHREVVVSREDIARAFPDVVRHAERPILRTAPAPLFLLAKLVREHGIKVVLTGEGADEMLGGYDLFREARIRRFWARAPQSKARPLLLDKLYPYLARGPARARAMAREFFARDLDRPDAPEFAHLPRWRSAMALHRLFAPDVRAAVGDPIARFVATVPSDFGSWDPLARDQYVEIRTLLSGYLLSAQGDRMAMGHSVEGRFPFLDRDVVALANSFPAGFKLHVLDEKHVLKKVAAPLVPASITKRMKQPYRAPDALALAHADWLDDALAIDSGLFDRAATLALARKCRAAAGEGQLSNADNMALVGVASSQLLHRELVSAEPSGDPPIVARTVIERMA
ncbi:MAG TPA: asparagine synthase (glutamine-hydrolyzing) [Kofleriaceae bacterium]|nr:asparagine synthase (glutamine-hydrolyzing) [Kofleriaceae bacterium]